MQTSVCLHNLSDVLESMVKVDWGLYYACPMCEQAEDTHASMTY